MRVSWMKSGMVLVLSGMLAACQTTKVGFPAAEDVTASVAPKPKAGADTLTPGGNARYNEAIEKWGDDISAAAGRLCRFHQERGMKISCPPRPEKEN